MAMLGSTDPKILAISLAGGLLPSLLWLWFWLREDKENPEPKGLLAICFLIGMASVFFILPIEKYIQHQVTSSIWQITGWATVEELIKYIVVVVIAFRTIYLDKPIDWPVYLIVAALGFAALENMLFLIEPVSLGQSAVGLLTGHLRFLGSTLLHTVSSGILGIFLGLSFYMGKFSKTIYLFFGLILAIALHSVFNFFIMRGSGNESLKVFAFLWVATIINLLLFEKLRRMSNTDRVAQ